VGENVLVDASSDGPGMQLEKPSLIGERTTLLLGLAAVTITLLLGVAGGAKTSAAAPSLDDAQFLPLILRGADSDLAISHVEITQSVQRADNSVPLVAGRPTVVRVFAFVAHGDPSSNVTVSLEATRSGANLGSVNSSPRAVPLSPTRADTNSTFNFLLPASWLSGNIVLVATVDAAGTVIETNESNNSLQSSLSFNVVPDLDIRIVPISYTHQGSDDPGTYPGQADDRIKDWIRRAFPVAAVNTSFRTPYLGFQGNLDDVSDWSELLYDVTDLKVFDGAPSSQFYYGLVPIRNGGDQWFQSGVAGIGWIGSRTAVGLNLPSTNGTGILAGHEIGHNMGRRHAPCGVPGTDLSYPYAGASIGEYGLEINGATIALRSPSSYVDMMSYCSPEWVSDYTYVALYNDQRARGMLRHEGAEPGIVVRARLDREGRANIQPVYSLRHLPIAEPLTSTYRFNLLDANGTVVSTQRATLLTAEEGKARAQALYASFPVPNAQVTSIRLEENGTFLAERKLTTRPTGASQHLSLAVGSDSTVVSWKEVDTPVLIRYSDDAGLTWDTLGVDILGGEFALDLAALAGADGLVELTLGDSVQSQSQLLSLRRPAD
jgi:hypothetical protein